ncbi:MAG TPA: Na+/H+ antiporter NhaC family protein [Virgibacillus sp.]|nr:Na+/H+ antiporter NhaC family protein [Virgibacillus sp.]
MENTIWSLLPPILAIAMVLLTRRVLVSLGVGIVAAAFFIANFNFSESVMLVWQAFKGVFVDDGALNTGYVFLLIFILLLGILTAFVSMMGGTKAFGDWMASRVKSRAGVQIMTMILGVIIFIDDYFNSLTVGRVAMPVTDKHRISRAKLAYIVDSTSAPVSVAAPISSWGAYIIAMLGSILTAHGVTEYSAFGAFVKIIPMNFYVWAALGTILVIAIRQTDFGPMREHEQRALKTGDVLDPKNKEKVDESSKLPSSDAGKVSDLIIPIVVLLVATLGFIYWSGYNGAGADKSLMNIFGEADVESSLMYGGIIGLLFTFLLFFRHFNKGKLTGNQFMKGLVEGIKSMLPAFFILIFAWTIVYLIEELETGIYLGNLVEQSNLSLALLPFIVFLMAGFIAFSTGTSWGSFGILLPIAGQIAASTDIELILPMFAAVLSGAVFGDHCSPISDTTILSSAGSGIPHIDHVVTQLPYALTAAGIAGLSYLILGLTDNVWFGLATVVVLLIVLFYILKPNDPSPPDNDSVIK